MHAIQSQFLYIVIIIIANTFIFYEIRIHPSYNLSPLSSISCHNYVVSFMIQYLYAHNNYALICDEDGDRPGPSIAMRISLAKLEPLIRDRSRVFISFIWLKERSAVAGSNQHSKQNIEKFENFICIIMLHFFLHFLET